MNWYWLRFESDTQITLGHAVHSSRFDVVVADLMVRGCGAPTYEPITDIVIDMPGMIVTTRPYSTFDLDGLSLTIPCEDVGSFILCLEALKRRADDTNTPYYKLHAFMKALVLSPEQHATMLVKLRALHPEAERRALEFYAVTKSPSEVLRETAAKINNVPLENVGDLGGHRTDRFRPRGGGQA